MRDAEEGCGPVDDTGTAVRIVVIDDHPLIREGLVSLLSEQEGFLVCGAAEGAKDGLELILEHQPEIALLDIGLQDADGFDVARRIHKVSPRSKILIVSVFAEVVYARQALAAGAHGFISKLSALDELLDAIHCVLGDKRYVSKEIAVQLPVGSTLARELPDNPFRRLSMRELQVFKAIGEGKSTTAIAVYLGISIKTVETHRANIKKKLSLGSAHELKECAIRWTLKAQE